MGYRTLKDLPRPYVNEGRLQIVEIDEDKLAMGFHERFASNADVVEGVSGRKSIDTNFDNLGADEAFVEEPASLGSGHPPPVDIDRHKYPLRGL